MEVTKLILSALALCSSRQWAYASRLQTIVDDIVDENVTVRLLLTRHAFSCANAVDQFGEGWVNKKQHILMKDPFLTNCGVRRSKDSAEQLFKNSTSSLVDLVLSSSMLRAMETAAFMYPNHKIAPCPYISEEGFGSDNVPRLVREQLRLLETDTMIQRKGLNADRLDMQWMESEHFSGEAREKPSWSNFKKFMAEALLPSLPAHLRKKHLTIAVVTHSHFLKTIPELMSNCKSYFEDKPKNNQVLALNYRFTTKFIVQKSDGSEPFPPKFMDPYSTVSDTWKYVKALFAEDNRKENVFGNMLAPKFPPWKSLGVNLHIERDFEFESDSGCSDLVDVPDKEVRMCETDYGEACQTSKSIRPKLRFIELTRSEIENRIERYTRKGRLDGAEKLKEGLAELRNFVCCTA